MVALALLACATVASGTPAAEPAYVLTDLGLLHPQDDRDAPTCINDAGQVVGNAGPTGFLWDNGRMTELAALPNVNHLDQMDSRAFAINSRGTIVGSSGSYTPVVMSGFEQSTAVQFSNGRATALTRDPGTHNVGCEACAVNSRGDIVGSDQHRGFCWTNGRWSKLGPLSHLPAGNDCHATGINDSRLIVGESTAAGTTRAHPIMHACLWRGGHPQDLGVLPGESDSTARAINDRAWVVGSSGHQAVLWTPGKAIKLGILPGSASSEACAVNDHGLIVGTATKDAISRAWLWRNGHLIDLTAQLPVGSGWTLLTAASINGRGQIVGIGTLNGKPRMFLLSPRS